MQHPGLRPGLLSARAVQISGTVDAVALNLLDKPVPRPVMAKSGWGSRASAAPTALGVLIHGYPSPTGLG
jgi:hypothetical protein